MGNEKFIKLNDFKHTISRSIFRAKRLFIFNFNEEGRSKCHPGQTLQRQYQLHSAVYILRIITRTDKADHAFDSSDEIKTVVDFCKNKI